MTEPKTATEIPATIMVFIPVPSHTMNRGARADLGRLFSTTRYGSRISEHFGECHKSVAVSRLIARTSRKLAIVSSRVMLVLVKKEKSFTMPIKQSTTWLGLLKKNESTYPVRTSPSHRRRKPARMRVRARRTMR